MDEHTPNRGGGTRRAWAWIFYAIFAVVAALVTIKGAMPNPLVGWAVSIASGAYAAYLYRGGRIVIISVWVMLAPLMLVALLFFKGSPASRSASDLQSMTCKEFMALGRSDRAEVADKLFSARYKSASSMGATNAVLNMEYMCEDSPSREIGSISI